jgi:hypothetical protein
MQRVNEVKKAKKPQGNCCDCGDPIGKGDSYKWIKKRYGPKVVAHMGCSFRPSHLTGGRLGEVYDAQEDASKAVSEWEGDDISDLPSTLDTLVEELQRLGDEYQESADNIREHFSESEKADECEEKAQELEGWRDEIEAVRDNLEEFEPEQPEVIECPECDEEAEHQEGTEYKCPKCGHRANHDASEDSDAKEQWVDEQRTNAQEAVDACPL